MPTVTVQVDGSSASTTVNVSAPAQLAQFNAVIYAGSLVSPGGRPLSYVVTGGSNYQSQYAGFRSANPGCKILSYYAPTVSEPGNNGIGTFPYSSTLPENYFLHTSGTRISSGSGNTFGYWMNIADSAYQQTAANATAASMNGSGSDGVFLDMIGISMHYAGAGGGYVSPPAEIVGNAAYQSAMEGLLSAIKTACGSKLVIANIGGASNTYLPTGDGQAIWKAYNGLIDGAMDESWTIGSGGTILTSNYFQAGLANVTWSEANGKISLLHAYTPGDPGASYALGTMMLVAGGKTSLTLTNTYSANSDIWQPSFNTATTLGSPLGPYTVNGAIYTRQFQGGTVTVDSAGHTGTL